MLGPIRERHQHLHVLAHDLLGAVPEQAFASRTVDLNARIPVYDDDSVDSGLDQCPEEGVGFC
jgi:hypothetical protein